MVVSRRITRHINRTSSSARKSPNPADSEPESPISSGFLTISPDSIHSPFYLTNGDNPGLSLISEVLDGSNYDNWRIAMNIALDAKNKIAFIDGSIVRPNESDQYFRIWSRCNSMVKSWLLNSVSKEIYKSILRFNDASEIWKDLSTRFHITSLPHSYQLSQQIWSLHQGSMDLSTYYTKLKTLWDELDGASCEETCHDCKCCKATDTKAEHSRVIKFLAGLNESYAIIRSQIIMKKHVPMLSEIYNLLDQDHSQRSILTVPNASACHIAAPDSVPISLNATQAAHYPQKQNKPLCSYCGYTGHTVETCFKIHGYPPGFKHKYQKNAPEKTTSTKPPQHSKPVVAQVSVPSASTENISDTLKLLSKDQIQGVIDYFNSQLQPSINQLSTASTSGGLITTLPGMAFSSSTLHFVGALRATGHILSSDSWIIDSGATHHVCHDKSLFEDISTASNTSVTLPTGLGVQIAGIGRIKMSEYMILNNVLYIPDFRLNLLSISQLTKDLGYRVSFDHSSCVIQDPIKGLMIGQGEEISNLYVLDVSLILKTSSLSTSFFTNVVVDSSLWHNRLGHPSDYKIDFVTDVLGIKQKNKRRLPCAICPLAKQKHLSFDSKNNMCANAFDLLHIDIWGPYSVPTVDGYRYFLTIVDDHSRVIWVYLLRTKDEVLRVFPDFLTMIENQFQCKVRGVRSDNAPELRFDALYKEKGIVAYHSCPETPEQNSVVERKHQHILNVARSLMFQAKVPLEYWGDCVLTAVFLINRLPTPLLKDKTPYEVLNAKKIDYKGLRVFGCLAFCSTSSKNRTKFQPRARPCVFLGYPAGYKGYKLLDLESNKIHISRNVVFHEEIFPFATDHNESSFDFFSTMPNSSSSSSTPSVANGFPTVVSGDTPVVVDDDVTIDSGTKEDSVHPVDGEKKKRSPKTPAYLQDYFCNMQQANIPYPLANYLSYSELSDDYKAYICSVNLHAEPSSFNQAKKFEEWLQAMNEELMALEKSDTWEICSLPDDKHAIGCRWVYKTKLNADGSLERYKARLVAKGFTQQEGVDFVDTFSPVAKMTTVKTLLAVAAAKDWSLTQLDISNAFLNGDLDEEIYMTLPPGYTAKPGESLPPNAVCRLKKSLYGLKQASRQWFLKFSSVLLKLGFAKSHADHTLFVKNVSGKYLAVLVYVDDIIITSNCDADVDQLKEDLKKAFRLRDLGALRYFLGLEIARSKRGIYVCQRKYVLELLEDTGLLACKPSSIPMDLSIKLVQDSQEPVIDDVKLYRRLVGKMMYLTITRPDITYAVTRLCQFASAPKQSHLKSAYKVLHYLKGTIGLDLFYSAESTLVLTGFTDADWMSCLDSRRSTSGYCMFLGNSLISWKSKKQQVVSNSSAESEYRAIEFASREVVWLRSLVEELQAPQSQPVALFCDSTAAIHIASNPVFHERTKHIEKDCHLVRDRIAAGLIKAIHVRTGQQLADAFTKPLFPNQFNALMSKMALTSIYSPS
ncbi:unnamed protein product [Microthlaspi erraticum]|uniref:Integrase catalytic domain-containing protein n=1 Tax=Microthlaspi erraticum TaxID=1685480 RepID=A0A6D2JTF8_9BRAS|nr:unnamed protein product [Microthlaspi erraticum]